MMSLTKQQPCSSLRDGGLDGSVLFPRVCDRQLILWTFILVASISSRREGVDAETRTEQNLDIPHGWVLAECRSSPDRLFVSFGAINDSFV